MKKLILNLGLFAALCWPAAAGETITYQGRLKEGGVPVTANRDFRFEFCEDEGAVTCVASPDGSKPFAVVNGLFKSTFTAPAVNLAAGPWYLRVKVGGDYLSPLEKLTAVPYAVQAASSAYASALAVSSGEGILASTNVLVAGRLTVSDFSVTPSTESALGVSTLLQNWNPGTEDIRVAVMGYAQSATPDVKDILAAGNFEAEVPATMSGSMIGLRTVNRNYGSSPKAVGLIVDSLQNSGTIGETYGILISTMTGGTQSSRPFALYSEDASALTHFAGPVGISSVPAYSLAVSSANGNLFWVAHDGVHATKFVGDGSGLTGVTGASGTDNTKVLKTGDTMTGQLTLAGSSLTVITPPAYASSLWLSTSAQTPHLYLSTSGLAGLGTSAPRYRLDAEGSVRVFNASQPPSLVFTSDSADIPGVSGYGASVAGVPETTAMGIIIRTQSLGNYSERLRVSGTGNVGISTGVPQARLDVLSAGSTPADMSQIWRDSSGLIVASMSATGQMRAVRYIGDGSALTGIAPNLGSASGTLAIGNGGTGATTAPDALSNLGAMPASGGAMAGTLTLSPNTAVSSTSLISHGLIISTSGSIATYGPGTGYVSGDLRGLGAVDLQTARGAAGQVASGVFSSVLGGFSNTASGGKAVVAGGNANQATGSESVVGGGNNNIASGILSVIPGGDTNFASGLRSFAAGYKAESSASGAFTWADSEGTLVPNSVQDRTFFKNRGGFLVSGSTNPAMTGLLDRGFVVTGNGLVGISTGAPEAALDVVSSATAAGVFAQVWRNASGVIVASMSSAGNMTAVRYVGDGSGLTGVTGALGTDNTKVLKAGDTMTGQLTLAASSLTISNLGTNLGLYSDVGGGNIAVPTGQSLYFETGGSDRMLIDNLGKVGIATTPSYLLDVGGPASFDGQVIAGGTMTVAGSAFSVAGSTLSVGAGRVGIGTSSPVSKLHLNVGNSGYLAMSYDDTAAGWADIAFFDNTSANRKWGIGVFADSHPTMPNSMYMWQNLDRNENPVSKYRMLISDAGFVGISSDTPKYRLVVSSGGGETGTIMAVSTGTSNLFWVAGDGAYAVKFTGNGSGLTNVPGDNLGTHAASQDLSLAGFRLLNVSTMTVGGDNVVISPFPRDGNYNYAISIGSGTGLNYASGIGIGYGAFNNYDGGVGVGRSADNNFTYGVGVGYMAHSNSSNGVGIGYSANTNGNNGVGLGAFASGNGTYGVGIGANASNNATYSVGVGAYSQGNSPYATGVGSYSSARSSSAALGYSAKAQNVEALALGAGAVASARRSVCIGAYCVNAATDTVKIREGYALLADSMTVSAAVPALLVSTNIYVVGYSSAAKYYGDGSGLTGVTASGSVLRAGDTMTGQLTLAGSSLTVTGNAFSVGGSTLAVAYGRIGIGTGTPTALLEVRDSNASSGYVLLVATGTDAKFSALAVTTGGVVGVGTLNPSTQTVFHAQAVARDFVPGQEDVMFGVMGSAHAKGAGTEDAAAGGHFEASVDASDSVGYLVGLHTNVRRKGSGAGTVGKAVGIYIDNVENQFDSDVIGDTMGLFIATMSTTGQTNKPYAIYSADPNAMSYFAGPVGIGSHTAQVALVISSAPGSSDPMLIVSTGSSIVFGVKGNGEVHTSGKFIGDGSLLTGVVASGGVQKTGDTMTGPLTLAGSTLTVTGSAFSVGGSTLAVLDGRVGIGIATPPHQLTIHSWAPSNITMMSFYDDDGSQIAYVAKGVDDEAHFVLSDGAGNNMVHLNAAGDNYMRGGRLGLGLTNPSAALDVAGRVVISTSAGNDSTDGFYSTGPNGIKFISKGQDFMRVAGYNVALGGPSVYEGTDYPRVQAQGNLSVGSGFASKTLPPNGMAVEGKVGIGTATPTALLEVRDQWATHGYVLVVGTGTSADRATLVVTTGGVVGVGTIFPDTMTYFHAHMTATDRTWLQEDVSLGLVGSVRVSGSGVEDAAAGAHFEATVEGGTSIGLAAGLHASVRRNSGLGNIGKAMGVFLENFENEGGGGTITNTYGVYIGTLTTVGQTNLPYALYSEDPDARTYFAGSVGIGTSTPNYPLHISSAPGSSGHMLVISTGSSYIFGVKGNGEVFTAGKYIGDGSMLTNLGISSITIPAGGLRITTSTYAGASGIVVSTGGAIQTTGIGHGTMEGNPRGRGAVDLQTARGATTNVAAGDYSVISGGVNNTAAGSYGAVGGGFFNANQGFGAVIAGGYSNETVNGYAAILGGSYNKAGSNGAYGAIAGGNYNTVNGYYSFVGGGDHNSATNEMAVAAGGKYNMATASNSVVGGGAYNAVSGTSAVIAGGEYNIASEYYSAVLGGWQSKAQAPYAVVGGGRGNVTQGYYSVLGGGYLNGISGGAAASVIAGGDSNSIGMSAISAAVLGGFSNNISQDAWYGLAAGGYVNLIGAGTKAAAILGGSNNRVYASSAAIAGGDNNVVLGTHSFIGAGQSNQAGGAHSALSGGMNNRADGQYSFVGGGYQNKAGDVHSVVAGGWLNAATAMDSFVGGGKANTAEGPYSFVGGGGPTLTSATGNHAYGELSAIVGGSSNTVEADGYVGFVGGGSDNHVLEEGGVVVGGMGNYAGIISKPYAAVVGGFGNRASGDTSFIGGGGYNTASGQYAAIPGGYANTAKGAYSFAAGYRSSSTVSGTFSWNDFNGAAYLVNDVPNQTMFRASGGFWVSTGTIYQTPALYVSPNNNVVLGTAAVRMSRLTVAEPDPDGIIGNKYVLRVGTGTIQSQLSVSTSGVVSMDSQSVVLASMTATMTGLPAGSWSMISFPAILRDTQGELQGGGTFRPKNPGRYLVILTGHFYMGTTGARGMGISVNGEPVPSKMATGNFVTGLPTALSVSNVFDLVVGDQLQFMFRTTDSAATLDPFLNIVKLN